MNILSPKRRLFAPEVVQTSAMDCGPAALKCLLEGFGIPVSYGRLREACQTEVDGTSIDTLEVVAAQLGLEAEQVMVPSDHLLLAESQSLPAIAVVQLANGLTHFVVIWRTHGSLVQVMDPGVGRRWITCDSLLRDLYIHSATIPAEAWRGWIEGDAFLQSLRRRLKDLGLSSKASQTLIDAALADAGWHTMAALDAATRLTSTLVRTGGVSKGKPAEQVLIHFAEATRDSDTTIIPEHYWMVRPAEPDAEGTEQIKMRGAVLVSVRGRQAVNEDAASTNTTLSPELMAARTEKPTPPLRELWRLLKQDGLLQPFALFCAMTLAAAGIMFEALLFQGLFDLSRKLAPTEQRIGAMALLIVFGLALLCLELPLAAGILRIGRRLEARLRVAFLTKIPRLGDRYFQSRLISDMAERAQSTQFLRQLPQMGGRFVRACIELALTAAGLIWLDPERVWIVLLVAVLSFGLPLVMQSRLLESDLRIRTHNGALSRFYLDALLGLVPLRAHGAERAMRREHESLLLEWVKASHGYWRTVISVEAMQSLVGFALASWLLFDQFSRAGASSAVLLMTYWALNLPALGQEIAMIAQQYPGARNITLRLLEPLGAPEEEEGESGRAGDGETEGQGVALQFEGVRVQAGGHLILDDFNLEIEAGSHIAIVGPSGAGKSSFVGLLLGWHRAAAGRVLVDGQELTGSRLEQLREETAWVDPAVQLWNRSFLDNLRYGHDENFSPEIGTVIEAADLRRVLEKMPDGLQTPLGESGGLVSGGEGQRVRLGRAWLKSSARLVILDEPFRGLDREKRRTLLARAREHWQDATLLCITHDISETLDFERVLVIDKSRIVEDAPACELAAQPDSLYRALLDAEEEVRTGMWANDEWRRLYVENGLVMEKKHGETKPEIKKSYTSELRAVG